MRGVSGGLVAAVALLGGCGQGGESGDVDVTWHGDVAPIVAEHCTSCHVADGIGPFRLDDYASAAVMATAMANAVEQGTMPPWGAEETDACQPRFGWKDDLRLSAEQKATLRAWADAGAPEGDPADAAELPEPPSLRIDAPDAHLEPVEPFLSSGDRDQFECFTYAVPTSDDVWLTGLQIEPDNTKVVHHVLVFADFDGATAALGGADGHWECEGGYGVDNIALVGAWAPGSLPLRVPDGTGMPLPAGARLFTQIHYHPAGASAESDASALDLEWTTASPNRETTLVLLGNASSQGDGLLPGPNDRGGPEFRIPADVADHTETIEFPIEGAPTDRYPIWEVGTHMHYVGTGMRITVDHANPRGDEPATECLVETPRWDFDWQRTYVYDAPLADVPTVRGGDTIRLECLYDNTLQNPGVARVLGELGEAAPSDVYLGESTQDEMCLGVFGIIL